MLVAENDARAERLLKEAIRLEHSQPFLDPDRADMRLALANSLWNQAKYDELPSVISSCLSFLPTMPSLLAFEFAARLLAEQTKEALEGLEKTDLAIRETWPPEAYTIMGAA